MANLPYVETLLGGLERPVRRALVAAFEHVLGNLRIGRPTNQARAENLQLYFLTATTPAVANTEFTVAHGLAVAPYLLIQVLPLQTLGAKMVRLEVSRVADTTRLYLKSPDTSAPITVAVEG